MSALILPNQNQPVEVNFNITIQPDGSLAVQAMWAGGLVQWPPMPAEMLGKVGATMVKAADEIKAKLAVEQANGAQLIQVG